MIHIHNTNGGYGDALHRYYKYNAAYPNETFVIHIPNNRRNMKSSFAEDIPLLFDNVEFSNEIIDERVRIDLPMPDFIPEANTEAFVKVDLPDKFVYINFDSSQRFGDDLMYWFKYRRFSLEEELAIIQIYIDQGYEVITHREFYSIRQLAYVLSKAHKIIYIDSFFTHFTLSLGQSVREKTTVLFKCGRTTVPMWERYSNLFEKFGMKCIFEVKNPEDVL